MADLVMAIDAGTTGITVQIIDGTSDVKARVYSEFTQHYPQPGWVEHDATEIWTVTSELMKLALAEARASGSDVAGIGITNQRETAVMWERATGRPIAPAIVWQCRRSTEICERLKAQGLEQEIRARTGLVLDPYFSGTKIVWYLENVQGLRARADAGEIAFGTVDSWLVWNLTGGEVHATEPSNASRTLLYSLRDGDWDPWVLDELDIPRGVLGEIKPTSGHFGDALPELVGGNGLPIAGIAGDQQ
ncbi:MAG: FGGY family carbohydrate kinase, partial [Actinomycetota bacterium]|nr:FGGY family carbohydrate kinase [Actinomycetota bacterium]